MKLTTIRPADKQWIAARMRSHLGCMLGMGVLCAIIRTGAPVPLVPVESNSPIEIVMVSESGIKSVMPDGWRRTKHGWEHVSTWTNLGLPTPASINELIAQQQAREPQWIRTAMARVSRVPPLMIAVIQITAIAAIVFVSESRRRKR